MNFPTKTNTNMPKIKSFTADKTPAASTAYSFWTKSRRKMEVEAPPQVDMAKVKAALAAMGR